MRQGAPAGGPGRRFCVAPGDPAGFGLGLCVGEGDVHMFHAAQSQLAAYPGRCAGRFAPPSSCVTVATV